ncbi:MAG: peptide chain release factor family protein [Planctomycetota bacterium]
MNPGVHPAGLPVDALLAECDMRFTRRSGPGGQHRNKVETAVCLLHRPTGLRAEANERRSQRENRDEAVFRLRLLLALGVRHEIESETAPSEFWQRRFAGGSPRINPRHEDYPAILAEALDALFHAGAEPRQAAAALGCSSTQLIKLVQKEPRAFSLLNQWRAERSLHALH